MNDENRNHPTATHHLVNQLDDKKKKSMDNRLLVAGILILLIVPAMVLGGWYWFGFITFFLLCATYEVLKAPQKKYPWYVWVFTYLITISYVYWFLVKFNVQRYWADSANFHFALESYFDYLAISLFGMILSFGFYSACCLFHKGFEWNDLTYLFTMTFFVGVGFQALLYIRYCGFAGDLNWGSSVDTSSALFRYWNSLVFFIFVALGTLMNDTMAYFVGMFFGKHKMIPRISPNKTWEGFFGGVLLGGLICFFFALICEICGVTMLPSMRIFGPDSKWWLVVILSFTLPLVGDLGDLTFSIIKRHYGFKDFSHVLGAHGGILDRFDSLSFCSIYASLFAIFSARGWNFFA